MFLLINYAKKYKAPETRERNVGKLQLCLFVNLCILRFHYEVKKIQFAEFVNKRIVSVIPLL